MCYSPFLSPAWPSALKTIPSHAKKPAAGRVARGKKGDGKSSVPLGQVLGQAGVFEGLI
ncbi:MAG: hypothetical protein OXS32_11105 [Verrucomicrobiales bacterium]|nr:hypothetical protein [Verrucomicrobiales bacterium]